MSEIMIGNGQTSELQVGRSDAVVTACFVVWQLLKAEFAIHLICGLVAFLADLCPASGTVCSLVISAD
ncbi:MAG: hypothetical protein KGI33_00650 [Thaumarchaeota archaeon]|nr:hypothetical protein [Nitrososphaerota archaeon]